MLAAVLSDGTAVNIVRRGADIIQGDNRFVTVVSDVGTVYTVNFIQEIEPTGVNAALAIADGVLSAQPIQSGQSLGAEFIYAFTSFAGEFSCPEVIEWLMKNYGLTFSPAGLRLYGIDGVPQLYAITRAVCDTDSNLFVCQSQEVDYALLFPEAEDTLLGCDGTAVVNPGDAVTECPAVSIANINSASLASKCMAFNQWLFYLSSGLPRELFE